ncbi:WhiB family transcriptional regulator [Georgenia faecalis]|uniref:Transcriptional regulator WhiB n=1 Tax=Georgenia faecalis TaxID=2483799 RepID=A0ABV9D5F9_9MICO|nr:WhiB family transcriptional regulator [Georgenia faecalis]
MSVSDDQTWAARAACSSIEPDELFVRGAAQRMARTLCFGCTVRMECLADALDSQVAFGVWGGLTERERRALLRRYPGVPSWSARLKDDDELIAELRAQRPPRILSRTRTRPA